MEITIKLPETEEGRKLAEVLQNPDTLQQLSTLLYKIDDILHLVHSLHKALAEMPGGIGVFTDKIDDLAEEYRLQGKDLGAVLDKLLDPTLIDRIDEGIGMLKEAPAMMQSMLIMGVDKLDEAMSKFVEQGILPEEAGEKALLLAVASAKGLQNVYEKKQYEKVSLFGMLGLMRDPDIQKGLGLMMEMLREIGKTVPDK